MSGERTAIEGMTVARRDWGHREPLDREALGRYREHGGILLKGFIPLEALEAFKTEAETLITLHVARHGAGCV